jgi:ribosomal protein L37AE/L43A
MTEKEKQKQTKLPKCNKCGSGFVYVRLKTGELCCRSCGNIEKVKREINK